MENNEVFNEVFANIETLYTIISEAWGVPLGNDKCIIERDAALQLLDEIKDKLPTEIAEAKRLIASREEYIASAKREVDAMKKMAEEQAHRMVDEQEILRIARARSAEILENAETKTAELQRAVKEYIDHALLGAEESLSAALQSISQSRARFNGLTTEPEESAPAAPAEEEPVAEEEE
ncbi:MAG: hypothetical protein ACOX7K_06215 [Oscillospiraceae bacterium]|jgi:cell division septum initiation protein DivIVA